MSLFARTLRILLVAIFLPCALAAADVLSESLDDRAAIERVYHNHRTGTKPPFEQAMPRAMLEQLAQGDRHKEVVLLKVYQVTVTPEMVEAEVRRIETTTRAPEMLAEIKQALGGDPARFARGMARPIVVERILRQRFENDDALHAGQRATAEKARQQLLAKEAFEGMHESTWELGSRPAEDAAPVTPSLPPSTPNSQLSTSSIYSNEATAQVAQPLGGSQEKPGERKLYFEDLDPELQKVLRVQLQKPGDVSAVIETPTAFLVFQAKEKSATALTASCLTVPKRGYDEWLAQQPLNKQP